MDFGQGVGVFSPHCPLLRRRPVGVDHAHVGAPISDRGLFALSDEDRMPVALGDVAGVDGLGVSAKPG